ncbi:MAG: response regulator transcription factor [Flavobacteriales bacterium]|nr:response regulator transcription factor [Flavobacteriales bacterium]
MNPIPNGTTILLVDDQTIMLDGIESLLTNVPELTVVGRAENGQQAVELTQSLRPDLVLMDINMPGMDGIEATHLLMRACPETKVIVLSMYGHKEFVLELLGAGIRGYLLKNMNKAVLLEAIATVSNGGKFIAPELKALTANGDQHKDREGELGYDILTQREMEIVRLILQERTTQEIADTLFLSARTVETHRRNILHKLDLRNTAGLVKYAMERGWGG